MQAPRLAKVTLAPGVLTLFSSSCSELDRMAGDVNLFFNDHDDPHSAEVEVMIAEPSYRGRGFGKAAVLAMMHYGHTALHVERFTAKIGFANKPSISLFSSLGFVKISESAVFEEVTLELVVAANIEALQSSWATLAVREHRYRAE
eukprot:m.51940 g.51940  ORF g.51940 m.51940 type:complete len:146 (-) comp48388_c0_seq1:41-478(-)